MRIVKQAFFVLIAAVVLAPAADPALLNLVMPDAQFVSGVQVDAAKNSAFGKYVIGQMQTDDPQFAKFIADTGFDPRRDLSEIVTGTSGTQDQPVLVVAGRGVFNPGAIINAATAHGAKITNYAGVEVITHATRGSNEGAIAFLGGSLAVMGSTAGVQGAIDRYKANAAAPAAIASKAAALSAANDAWFLSTGLVTNFFTGKMAGTQAGANMQLGLLQAVQQASGGVKFGASDIRIAGEALTRSDKDASSLADVVRFIAGMIQMNAAKDPNAQKAATLLDSMTLATSGPVMQISLVIPEAVAEQLLVPQQQKQAAPAGRRPVHGAR